MNQPTGYRQAIGQRGRFGYRLLRVALGLLTATRCLAQPEAGTLPTDPVRIGILIEPHQPLTPYQQHAHLIQEELISLGKALNHLSTVNPTDYSGLQDKLLTYLNGLKTQDVDYGAPTIYESAMLILQHLNEQTKRSLINGRRYPDDNPVPHRARGTLFRRTHPFFAGPISGRGDSGYCKPMNPLPCSTLYQVIITCKGARAKGTCRRACLNPPLLSTLMLGNEEPYGILYN